MKKILVTMMALSLTIAAQGQTETIDTSKFVVTYDYAVQTKMGRNDSAFVDSCQIALLVGKRHTMQMERSKYVFAILGDRSVQNEAIESSVHNYPTIWTNVPDGEMTTREFFAPKMFRIEEPMEAQKWTLTDDTLTITGYACKTASCEYGGRKWKVWFTEEIPSTAGPWKLHGLPGLIVKATDADGIHTFCLSSLEQKAVTMTARSYPTDLREKRDKFIKQRNKILCDKRYIKNPSYYLPADVVTIEIQTSPGVYFSFVQAEGGINISLCIPSGENVRYYQPLELK